MIYTVFPKDDYFHPQDFATRSEAEKYAEELKTKEGVDSTIESTEGEVI